MIRRFTITGLKRFEHQTKIDLDAVTVLVGANNSGKSTILEALTLFHHVRKPDEFDVLPVAELTDLWPNGRTTIGRRLQ